MTKSTTPTFTITFKLIGKIEEESYETRSFKSEEELEEELERRGTKGQVSYYLYSKKGGTPKRMSFI